MGCGGGKEKQSTHPIHTTWEKNKRPIVFGHRGGSLKFPENSLAALKHVAENGLDGAEIDVILTKDSKVILFHDENTEFLTGTSVDVLEATWEDLSKLRYKKTIEYDAKTLTFETEEPIALLDDVLKWVKEHGKFLLNIEMKPATPSLSQCAIGAEVAKLVRQHKVEEQVIITGFDFFKLHALEKEYKGLHSGFQYDDGMTAHIGEANVWFEKEESIAKDKFEDTKDFNFVRWLLEKDVVGQTIGATVVGLEHTVIDADTIPKLKDKGLAVGSYTLFPIDFRSIKKKETDEAVIEKESKRILKQLFDRKINYVEADDAIKAMQVVKDIQDGKSIE